MGGVEYVIYQAGMYLLRNIQGEMRSSVLLWCELCQQDAEFVSRNACDDVTFTQDLGQPLAYRLEQCIPNDCPPASLTVLKRSMLNDISALR